jgi:hypothetical protein
VTTMNKRVILKRTIVAVAALLASTARADDDHEHRRALARLEHAEPTVEATVVAALRHADLDGHPEISLRRRARWSAALPNLTVRAGRDTVWDEPNEARTLSAVEQRLELEARATWRLDQLVFDSTELRIAALGQQRARARATLAAQTTALYYKRRAAQIELLWHPPETIEEQIRRDLMLQELTAQLDAITGGWWSRSR